MKKIVLTTVAVFIFATCSNAKKYKTVSSSDYSDSAAKYMPLAIGNKWVYRVNYMGVTGQMDIEIVATDQEWFIDNKGVKLKVDRRGIRDKHRYLLMFPLQKSPWISIVDLQTREVRETVGVNETINVLAGKFEGAVKVHTFVELPESKVLHSFQYFVAGIGIVKIETVLEDIKKGQTTTQTVTELEKYSLVNSSKN